MPGTAGGDDTLRGSTGDDALFGEGGQDTMFGDEEADWLEGGFGGDTMRGGLEADVMYGDPGNDEMYGDSGNDLMYGGDGKDVMYGGMGEDDAEGNAGPDTMNGDAGQDNLIGGSSEDDNGVADAGDTIHGNGGVDFIAGDNARMVRLGALRLDDPSVSDRAVTLFNVNSTDSWRSGDDILHGDESNDWIWGQGSDDTIFGGPGIDRIEGNAEDDTIHGGADRDLLVGGTTANARLVTDGGTELTWKTAWDERGDALGPNDTIHGDAGQDVILGDNGELSWLGLTFMMVTAAGTYGNDTLFGGDDHDQVYGQLGGDDIHGDDGTDHLLGDLGAIGVSPRVPATLPGGAPNRSVLLISPDYGGDDFLFGDRGQDFAFGGAANDLIFGGVGDDHLEGNGGADEMYGLSATFDAAPIPEEVAGVADEGDQDDLIGGSSTVHPDAGYSARDEGDLLMQGNAESDFLIGDNGEITRQVKAGDWVADARGDVRRGVALFDVNRPDPSLAGGDRLEGGAGIDWLWGQAENDRMWGGPDPDRLDGNAGDDLIHGDGGFDLIAGGSTDSAALVSDGAFWPTAATDGRSVPPSAASAASASYSGTGSAAVVAVLYLPYIVKNHSGVWARLVHHNDVFDGDDALYGDEQPDAIIGDNGRWLDWYGHVAMTITPAGTYGDDEIHGGDGDDQAYGQLGGDEMYGENGADYFLGDLGRIDTVSPGLRTAGRAGRPSATCASSRLTWADTTSSTAARATTTCTAVPSRTSVEGGLADDHLEGNGGRDSLYGLDASFEYGATAAVLAALDLEGDEDDLIGGSSSVHPFYETGADDAGEGIMEGNAEADVLIGDNGEITRRVEGDAWAIDPVTGGVARAVTLKDLERTATSTPPLSTVSGGDRMEGNGGRDRLFGQGGNDCMKGDDEVDTWGTHDDDYLEGNLGSDWMAGNEAEDDLVGGSPYLAAPGRGLPDEADFVFGGPGADVLVGDNGSITRFPGPPASYTHLAQRLGMMSDRGIVLLDLDEEAPEAVYGNDQLSGGAGVDVLFGQDGGDYISGGSGDDYAEGNGGADWLFGDRPLYAVTAGSPAQLPAGLPPLPSDLVACGNEEVDSEPHGQDDLIGGSSWRGHRDQGDWIYGDGGADFALGDNGQLLRQPRRPGDRGGALSHRRAACRRAGRPAL